VFETDAAGTFVGSSYVYATARDWARFGLLYLQDGVWNGTTILPPGWVEYSRTPTPTSENREYAAHFWANAGDPQDPSKRRFPHLPPDAYQASGFQGPGRPDRPVAQHSHRPPRHDPRSPGLGPRSIRRRDPRGLAGRELIEGAYLHTLPRR
jgi:hypothetical protein